MVGYSQLSAEQRAQSVEQCFSVIGAGSLLSIGRLTEPATRSGYSRSVLLLLLSLGASKLPCGSVKNMLQPDFSLGSAQIVPLWRSTIRLQIARPTPLPGYASRLCKRLNMANTFSVSPRSMPMPLSLISNCQLPSTCAAPIFNAKVLSDRNFIEFSNNVKNSCCN